MSFSSHITSNRKARRAEQARNRKLVPLHATTGHRYGPAVPVEHGTPIAVSRILLDPVADIVRTTIDEEIMARSTGRESMMLPGRPTSLALGWVEVARAFKCFWHAAAGEAVLRELGFSAHAVVGAVEWSAGSGNADVVTTGTHPRGVHVDLASGAFHAWVEITDDGLIDFAAHTIGTRFAIEHHARPLTTPRAGWRRFGSYLTHSFSTPMNRPFHDRNAAYWYGAGDAGSMQRLAALEEQTIASVRRRALLLLAKERERSPLDLPDTALSAERKGATR